MRLGASVSRPRAVTLSANLFFTAIMNDDTKTNTPPEMPAGEPAMPAPEMPPAEEPKQ